MAVGEYGLAEAGEPMGDGSLGLFLRGCFAATDEDRSTGRALVLFGLVGSIAACLRLLEMEISTKAIWLAGASRRKPVWTLRCFSGPGRPLWEAAS